MGAVGRCDLGKVRSQNEDSIYISENPDTEFEYFIVADGMGGHNAGEIASQSAIKFFNEYIEDSCDIKDSSDLLDAFVGALGYSNQKIFEMSQSSPSEEWERRSPLRQYAAERCTASISATADCTFTTKTDSGR